MTHVLYGPIRAFLSRVDAEHELAAVYEDEPAWRGDLWVERSELRVGELPAS